MQKYFRLIIVLALLLVAHPSARGFSLLGPFDTWQTGGIGYQLTGDLGGPMALGEEYRWDVPTVYYAFDESWLSYFGTNGVRAAEQAFKVLNDLPPVSKMSASLSEFPLDTIRPNYQAQALGLRDVKSTVLGILLEEMGVADAIRYSWTLRARATQQSGGVTVTNYTVISRNFDPLTLRPTPYVNGVLYTYVITEPIAPGNYADAVDTLVSSIAISSPPVSSYLSSSAATSITGNFLIGLTRDDVGALRYTLRKNNYNVENLPPNSAASAGVINSPWLPAVFGTNSTAVTNFVAQGTALRPGREHIRFVRTYYDSIFGQAFIRVTNTYSDPVVLNSRQFVQTVTRTVNQPDILFTAQDLGTDAAGIPFDVGRTIAFSNNNGLNGQTAQAGPGVIRGPITIRLTNLVPIQITERTPTGDLTVTSFTWGSFDGSPATPIIYPDGASITALENQVLSGH